MKKVIALAGTLVLSVPVVASAGCNPNISRTLSYGSRGQDVSNLQLFLGDYGGVFTAAPTGFFGAVTQTAVQKWQATHGVISYGTPLTTGYGIVGRKTRAAIIAYCANQAKGRYPSGPIQSLAPKPISAPSPTVLPQNTVTSPSCVPSAPEMQTLPCPSGQTGAITQTRTSSCPGPAWSGWQTISNTCQAATSALLIDSGWDPGLLHRRATVYKTDPAVYFESCPDDTNGCYNNGSGIPIGGGFYTLSPDVGGTLCKINSGGAIQVKNPDGTQRQETCPFFFSWISSSEGTPAAKLLLDTSNWTDSFTPNIYMGFHDQLPQGSTPNGSNYFGGKDFPLINDARMSVNLAGDITLPNVDYSRGRFLAAIAWYVPRLQKEFVVELNLNNAGNLYMEPAWSTTAVATVNPGCPLEQKCLYLGGQYWGFSPVSTEQKKYSIDWSAIVKKLVELGYIPNEAYGPYQTSVIYFGPEVLGKAKAELRISNLRMQSLVQ